MTRRPNGKITQVEKNPNYRDSRDKKSAWQKG